MFDFSISFNLLVSRYCNFFVTKRSTDQNFYAKRRSTPFEGGTAPNHVKLQRQRKRQHGKSIEKLKITQYIHYIV